MVPRGSATSAQWDVSDDVIIVQFDDVSLVGVYNNFVGVYCNFMGVYKIFLVYTESL